MLIELMLVATLARPLDDITAIKALRRNTNVAISQRDYAALRASFDPGYHIIRGASGAMVAGPEATEALIKDDLARDPGFVGYERTTTKVRIGTGGARAAEEGRWVGRWTEADGTMNLTGVYLAMWVKVDGVWRIKSEAYVALKCSGSAECKRFTL